MREKFVKTAEVEIHPRNDLAKLDILINIWYNFILRPDRF